MKTKIVQMNSKSADIEENSDKIKSYINSAKDSELVIFPALAITGSDCRDYFSDADFIEKQNAMLDEIAEMTKESDKDVILGCAEKDDTGLYSAIVLISDGKKTTLCRKKNLSIAEQRYFKSGAGAQNFEYRGKLTTVTLDPVNECKTDVLLNFAPENFQMDTIQKRIKNKNYSELRINPVGLSGAYLFDGRSYYSNKKGMKLAQAAAFTECELDFDDKLNEEIPQAAVDVYDETIDALTFGLKDFCAKNGFKKIVIGLSGGIDSALTAAIACRAMGAENVTGITMPSEYSSSGSVDDSVELAKNLGMECKNIPIKPLFETFIDKVQDKKYNDLAEENLQSRLRAIILMNYSNRYSALLLSTGNKSEVATGYCTLYGDTCGGFNLIGDIYKTDVYKVAEHINKNGVIIPINTMTKAPSAELRPDQKDTDSLPEYDVLDKVIRMYFEDRIPIEEIEYICPNKPVRQIIKTILRAEFKRKQMTAGIKLSTRSFGCDIDYPIV